MVRKSFKAIVFLTLSFFPALVLADRLKLPLNEIKKWKMRPVEYMGLHQASTRIQIPKELRNLDFPIRSNLNDQNEFSKVMQQYQDISWPAYFHGGVDIRGEAGQKVLTPVGGVVEAGYYAYNDEENGKSTKYFLSLKEALAGHSKPPWGKLFFEVAVTTPSGYRFEYHHIDPDKLPDAIFEKAQMDDQVHSALDRSIPAGQVVGNLIQWPDLVQEVSYHHLHYNVISPTGLYINPLKISIAFDDRTPPKIKDIYAVSSFCAQQVPQLEKHVPGLVLQTKKFFVLNVSDLVNSNSRFPHPPARIQVIFANQSAFEYDFTQSLSDQNGLQPDLRNVYLQLQCDHSGRSRLATSISEFFFKIPVPPQFSGPVKILIDDQNGNSAEQIIQISSQDSI